MDDAATCRHPVHVPRVDRLDAAEAVTVNNLAFEQIGQRGEADMRMGPDVWGRPGAKHHWSKMIKEDKGAYHLALCGRQRATNLEPSQIANRRKDHLFHGACAALEIVIVALPFFKGAGAMIAWMQFAGGPSRIPL